MEGWNYVNEGWIADVSQTVTCGILKKSNLEILETDISKSGNPQGFEEQAFISTRDVPPHAVYELLG